MSSLALPAYADIGKGVKESGDVEYPQDYKDDYDSIENRLDGALHGNESIHKPEENTHDDQNFDELNERHGGFDSGG
jgi:hypothetical protein